MIISVHVPKTAGTTLVHYLKTYFSVFEDYGPWQPTNLLKARLERSALVKKVDTYDCIHGHFPVMKYRFYPNAQFITFVREPLERIISNYYFWKKVYEIGNAGKDLYLISLFKKNISLNDFLFEENLQNHHWQYMKGIPLSRYSFIGIADEKYFAADINYLFNEILQSPLEIAVVERLNKTDYNQESISKNDIEDFRKFHKHDYEIYAYALQKRTLRLASTEKLM